MIKLRPYQRDASDAVFKEWQSVRSTLVVMPTGSGKSLLFADIIRRKFPKRAMVLAHREELIWQARDKIQKVTGLKADVEMGNYKASVDHELFHPRANVIVSTIQTHCAGGDGAGRMTKFNPQDFGLLIIDEAHHSTASSYKRVVEHYCQNPNLVVLGVTATPDRADEEALGQIFETVAYDYEILDAINDGWLVPIEQQMVSVDGLDFSSVRTTAGDLNGSDLEEVMLAEKNLHGIAGSTIEIIGDRRGLGFASSVQHAKNLADIFNRHRSGMAAWVCGKTDKDERKQIISDFASGKIQFLWNCGVFTEGFDDSGVEVISMARPTKSRALYGQMAGRGTRPHESIAHRLNDAPVAALRRGMIARSCKPACLILDFVGNSGKHKLVTTADILGGKVSDEVVQAAKEFARKAGRPVRIADALEEEEKRLAEKKQREQMEAARKAKLVAKTSFKTQKIDPFDVLQIKPVKSRGWDDGKVLKEGSKKIIRSVFGKDPGEVSYTEGMQLVKEFFRRKDSGECTFGQAKMLKKYGYDTHMKFDEAKRTIDAIAQNGWRRPAALPVKIPPRPSSHDNAMDGEIPF